LPEKLGEALAIQLATVSRAGDYPRSTFAITLVSRRPCDPGLGFPRAVRGWRLDERGGSEVGGRDEVVGVQGIDGEIGLGLAI